MGGMEAEAGMGQFVLHREREAAELGSDRGLAVAYLTAAMEALGLRLSVEPEDRAAG